MAQSLLAINGMRSKTLGSAASLAIAMPLSEGYIGQDSHTAANRSGWFGVQTLGSEQIGMVLGGAAGVTFTHNGANVDLAVTGAISASSISTTGVLVVQPAAVSSGTQTAVTVITAANTNQTASTEIQGMLFNLSATRQWATGAITTQREVLFQAPTYAFVGASTITTSATVAITGPPIAGANATLTTAYSLWSQSGLVQFDQAANFAPILVVNQTATGNNGAGIELSTANNSANTRNWAIATNFTVPGDFAITQSTGLGGNPFSSPNKPLYINNSGSVTTTGSGGLTITQSVVAGGARQTLTINPAANLSITSGTESPSVLFNSTTRQWATSTPATQREWEIQGPVYACDTVAQTITSAATLAITAAPSAGTNVTITNAYALWVQAGVTTLAGQVNCNGVNSIVATQSVAGSGTPAIFNLIGAAHTTLTSGAEVIDVNVNLARTVQWATSPPATQRAFIIQAPTYSCDTAAQTITTAATFDITGAPIAGTNVTITNAYALRVEGGTSLFTGSTIFQSNSSWTAGNAITINQGVNTSGIHTAINYTGGASTGLTSGTEQNDINFNMARILTWATSTPATERAFLIQAPTYACDTVGQTITTAATVAITGAPAPGTNVTLTNTYALWIQAGKSVFNGNLTLTGATTSLLMSQAAAASGSNIGIAFTGGAHTGLTSGTEVPEAKLDIAQTVQWATSTPATQRAVLITAPTYACDTAGQTITSAATFAITGAPVAGTNVTLTNTYALWVQAGQSLMAGKLNLTGSNSLVITQPAVNAQTVNAVVVNGGAHTAAPASVEMFDVNVNLNRTVQFATGALATQRAVVVQAPTYAFVGASTITTAATFAITGPPVAGTNATLSNAFALWVQSGYSSFQQTLFQALVTITDGNNILLGTGTGTKIGTGTNQKIGFFNATPVVQPASPSGNTHTPTAGSTTNVFVNTTFDGSIGSTAYTIGDIVIALKNLGLLAQ